MIGPGRHRTTSPPTNASTTARPSRVGHVLAALLYLALALWVQRSILAAPRTMVPMPAAMAGAPLSTLYQADQRFVIATIVTNVQRLLGGGGDLPGFGFCYPLRDAYTLGEHMFGESLLALPVYLLSGDPVLSYNVAVIVSVWITALAMYALALHWTGSIPAAFVAGMAFAFTAARLSNPAHPFVHGNLWTPLALLFANQLFTRRRWRDAAALALAIVLQLLESFYQVLALAILGGAYGLDLLVRHRRSVLALLPKLLAVAVVVGAATWLVLGPYLHTRARWGVLQGRAGPLLIPMWDYLPGGPSSVGLVALLLAVIGLADRVRGPRRVDGHDPRIVFTVAGLLVGLATLAPFRLSLRPRVVVPNILSLLESVVPGLDAVRVLSSMRFGVYLVVSFLAAYGTVWVTERLRGRWRYAAAAGLSLCVLLEAYDSTGTLVLRPSSLVAYRVSPSQRTIDLVEDLPAGAVLDLPFGPERSSGKLVDVPHYVLLAAYHGQPVAACYNSFPSPLQGEVKRRTDLLPDRSAADALYAMGFRTVLIHPRRLGHASWVGLVPLLEDPQRMTRVGESDGVTRFTLSSPIPVTTTLAAISPASPSDGAPPPPPVAVAAPVTAVDFRFENRGSATFRHPTLEPISLTAHWYDSSGAPLATSRARGMLPITLTRGESVIRSIELSVPQTPAGVYQIEITTEDQPEHVLARREVRVSGAADAASEQAR